MDSKIQLRSERGESINPGDALTRDEHGRICVSKTMDDYLFTYDPRCMNLDEMGILCIDTYSPYWTIQSL